MTEPGRILALDTGEVRIGVAVSDPLGMMAHAHSTIQMASTPDPAGTVAELVRETGARYVVVGLPLDQNGELGPQARKVMAFVEALRAVLQVPVVTQDERFTTAAVHRAMAHAGVSQKKLRGQVDKLAAQQILQTHLDRLRNQRDRES